MKIITRALIIGIIGFVFSSVCLAEEPEKKIETFIAMIKAGKAAEAVDYLYGGNRWMQNKSDAITNVRNQIGSLNNLLGELKNHEKLQEITVGSRFKYVSYLAAYERQPVRFVFEFYKPENTWLIFGFTLDDKLDDDVEKFAKETIGK